jgi:hypothetical protein
MRGRQPGIFETCYKSPPGFIRHNAWALALLMPSGPLAYPGKDDVKQRARLSRIGCNTAGVGGLLRRKLFTEQSGDRQSDRHKNCKEPDASASGKTSGPKYEGCARVANRQLILQRVAFDN